MTVPSNRLTPEETAAVLAMIEKLGEPFTAARLGISGPTLVRAVSPLEMKPKTIDAIRIALAGFPPAAVDAEAARLSLARQALVDQREQAREAVKAYDRRAKLARKCGIFLNEITPEESL